MNQSSTLSSSVLPATMVSPVSSIERIVLPGDDVTADIGYILSSSSSSSSGSTTTTTTLPNIRLGTGLMQDNNNNIICTKAGILLHLSPNRFYILSNQKRYIPAVGDTVVGIITDKSPESYKVRIHGTAMGILSQLSFDGASKRNKPNLSIGTVIFARIHIWNKYMEPELSCQVLSGPRKDFTTGQSVFGPLYGGTLIEISIGLAKRLLNPSCALLSTFGSVFPFEIAVGLNGLVWVACNRTDILIALCTAIEQAEYLDEEQTEKLALSLIKNIKQ